MEILLWLVPPLVVTVLAMGWVTWLGRDEREESDPERAAVRMARALERPQRTPWAPRPPVPAERTGAVAVRPARIDRAS